MQGVRKPLFVEEVPQPTAWAGIRLTVSACYRINITRFMTLNFSCFTWSSDFFPIVQCSIAARIVPSTRKALCTSSRVAYAVIPRQLLIARQETRGSIMNRLVHGLPGTFPSSLASKTISVSGSYACRHAYSHAPVTCM
jgi:hypothetical protein